jgi:hypothetical protein
MQNVVKLAHFTSALHDPRCHFIFGLWRVSLAEYIVVLRVLSPLVAGCDLSWRLQELVGSCRKGEVWSRAWSFWVIFALMLLLEVDLGTGMYLK